MNMNKSDILSKIDSTLLKQTATSEQICALCENAINNRFAAVCVKNGADELDMVINIGLALEGNWHAVRDDIAAVVEAAQGKCVKVIVETCFLNKEQIAAACREAAQAGAQYVKTSTGMAEGGAKEEDVRLMHDTVLGRCRVKAAGGIRTLADCEKMIAAGAERIGTGNAASIAEEK